MTKMKQHNLPDCAINDGSVRTGTAHWLAGFVVDSSQSRLLSSKWMPRIKGACCNGSMRDSKSLWTRFESLGARQTYWIGTVDVQGSSKPL